MMTTTTTPSADELAAVPQHLAAHVADPQTVDEGHPGLDPVELSQLLPDLHDVAVLADERPLGRDPDLVRQPGMVLEVPPFAVDRDEPAGSHQREHQPELLLRGVTAGVHRVGRACGTRRRPVR